MKYPFLLMLGLGLSLSGCGSVSQVDVLGTAEKYRAVHTGMTKEQVFAAIGAPDRVEKSGYFHWEVWSSKTGSSVELNVLFDANGVARATRLRGPSTISQESPPALREAHITTATGSEDVILPYSGPPWPAPDWTEH
jgi:outer membrane protein assembly factor BamE (lipoprotein component of BamABCDE complex)